MMTTTMIKMITIVPMPIYMEWLLSHRTAPRGGCLIGLPRPRPGGLDESLGGCSDLTGEIFEMVPERAVLPERNAQFLGSRVTALPGGQQRVLPFPDGQHKRPDAVVDNTGRQLDAGARIIDERRLDLVPAHAGTCAISDSRCVPDWLRHRTGRGGGWGYLPLSLAGGGRLLCGSVHGGSGPIVQHSGAGWLRII